MEQTLRNFFAVALIATVGLLSIVSVVSAQTGYGGDAVTCSMHANPGTIDAGQSSTLIWYSSDNVVSANITNIGDVLPEHWYWISSVPATTTYTLTVEDADGNTGTCEATIEIEEEIVYDAPTCEAYADPSTITAEDGSTTLVWSSENSTHAKLHPTGSASYFADVSANGSWGIGGINNSRSYSVTVWGLDGSTVTCDMPIIVEEEVVEPTALSCEMGADPTSFTAEDGATVLNWTSTGAVMAKLSPAGSDSFFATVPVNGMWHIGGINNSRGYDVTVYDADGNTETCTVDLTVI